MNIDCFVELNNFEEGKKIYDQIILINDDIKIRFKRGKLNFKLQQYDIALNDFKYILSKSPIDIESMKCLFFVFLIF